MAKRCLAYSGDRMRGQMFQAIFFRRRHQPRRPPPAKIRPGRPAAKAWEDENRPQLPLTGPRLAKLLQVLIGLLRPLRVERLRRLLGRDVSEAKARGSVGSCQCLERSGRFGPLACQLEIFLTASGIGRQLGRQPLTDRRQSVMLTSPARGTGSVSSLIRTGKMERQACGISF